MKITRFFKFPYAESGDIWTANDEEYRMQKIDEELFFNKIVIVCLSACLFVAVITIALIMG